MTPELEVIPPALRCRRLLSKGIYINHGIPEGQEVTGDGNFWCGLTQTIYGPDDKLCDAEHCSHPSRTCYES